MTLLLSPNKYGLRLRLLVPSLSTSSELFKYRLTSSSLARKHSTMSSSPSKYEFFFPNHTSYYLSNTLDWYATRQLDWYTSGLCGDQFPQLYHPNFNAILHKFPEFKKAPHYHYLHSSLSGNFEAIPIQVGHHFDAISLLSTHGGDLVRIPYNNVEDVDTDFVKADSSRGKSVLLCCVFLPCLWINYDSFLCRLLSSLVPHIGGHPNFEIVFVPKMRPNWDDDEGVFNQFFSAFPGCLVPFTHKYRRDYICKSLNFGGQVKGILLDPSHNVLEDKIDYIVDYDAFSGYNNHLMSLCYQNSFTNISL